MPKEKAERSTSAPQRKIVYIKPEGGVPCFYANHLFLGQTVFDARILFGEVTDVNDERVEISHRVQVTMSWLETKVLGEWLVALVKDFEQKNGPIKIEFDTVTNPSLPGIPKIDPPKSHRA